MAVTVRIILDVPNRDKIDVTGCTGISDMYALYGGTEGLFLPNSAIHHKEKVRQIFVPYSKILMCIELEKEDK